MLRATWPASLALLVALPAAAALRAPQVPVFGTALQSYFQSVRESVDVGRDQRAEQVWSVLRCGQPIPITQGGSFQLELGRTGALPDSFGVYDPLTAGAAPVGVFPAEARPGWFAVVSISASFHQVRVSVFDDQAVFLHTHRLPWAGNVQNIGFWLRSSGAVLYSEDARNPGGAAQWLAYAGTGINSGALWLCGEDRAADEGVERDYADVILFVEIGSCGDPVQRTSWGALKSRFR